jgi:hypothetical protein
MNVNRRNKRCIMLVARDSGSNGECETNAKRAR